MQPDEKFSEICLALHIILRLVVVAAGRSHSHVARALALWFVMASLQLFASSTIPNIIAVFLYNPLSFIA